MANAGRGTGRAAESLEEGRTIWQSNQAYVQITPLIPSEAKYKSCPIRVSTSCPAGWCSTVSEVFVRDAKKPMARNVSKALLYIYADLDADGTAERYPLFDDALEGYYWDYDNTV